MSKWNDFFDEQPPIHHAEKIMQAAEPILAQQARMRRRKFLLGWVGASFAAGLASVFGLIFYQRKQAENFQLVEFIDLEESDLAIASDQDFDIELLNDLDLLEEEDV